MSVLAPVVQTWDGVNRRIYLKQGITEFHPITDIYAEYRNERRTNEGFRKYEPLIKAEGNIPKGAGRFVPRYLVLLTGSIIAITTKIVPYNEVDQLTQSGDIITDVADTDPNIYDLSSLTVPKPIFITPPEAEIITVVTDLGDVSNSVWAHADAPTKDYVQEITTKKVGRNRKEIREMKELIKKKVDR